MEKTSDIIFYDCEQNLCRMFKDPFCDSKGIVRYPSTDSSFYDAKGILRTISEDGTVTFYDGSLTERTINIKHPETITFYDYLGYWVEGRCCCSAKTYEIEEFFHRLTRVFG